MSTKLSFVSVKKYHGYALFVIMALTAGYLSYLQEPVKVSAATGFIVFARDGSIYKKPVSGSETLILQASGNSFYHSPVISPDAAKIAFTKRFPDAGGVTTSHVLTMNLDGSGVADITPEIDWAADPDWSPDSAQIAFVGDCDPTFSGNSNFVYGNSPRIYKVSASGGSATVLAQSDGGTDPSWSPDGAYIAFAFHKDGNPDGIARINSNGGNWTRLTTDAYPTADPSWSPSGSEIAYGRNYPYAFFANEGGTKHGGNPNLSAPSGGDIVRYISGSQIVFPYAGSEPSWSPLGIQLLFTCGGEGGNRDICKSSLVGSTLSQAVADLGQETSGSWRNF